MYEVWDLSSDEYDKDGTAAGKGRTKGKRSIRKGLRISDSGSSGYSKRELGKGNRRNFGRRSHPFHREGDRRGGGFKSEKKSSGDQPESHRPASIPRGNSGPRKRTKKKTSISSTSITPKRTRLGVAQEKTIQGETKPRRQNPPKSSQTRRKKKRGAVGKNTQSD